MTYDRGPPLPVREAPAVRALENKKKKSPTPSPHGLSFQSVPISFFLYSPRWLFTRRNY